MIERITDPRINLTDKDTTDPDGLLLPALTNVGMGTVFEELLRKFNEENNNVAELRIYHSVAGLKINLQVRPVSSKN